MSPLRALALHLRAGQLGVVAVVLTGVDLVLLGLRDHYWVGVWPETGAAAAVPAAFLSIAAAGIAAWISGARARHHLVEQLETAARPRVLVEGVRLLAVLVAVLGAYAVGVAVAFVVTARTFPPGVGLFVSYAAVGALTLVLATSWGWLLGRYLGPRAASTAAVLSWLLVLAFVADPADLIVVSGPAWLAPDAGGLAVRAGVALALAAVVVAALPPSQPWRRRRLPALVPLAATTAALAVVAATPGTVLRPVPAQPLCSTTAPGGAEFCLWPEHAKYQQLLAPVAERVAVLPDQLVVPATFTEYGLERIDPAGTRAGEPTGDLLISEGRTDALASTLATPITTATFADCDQAFFADDSTPEAIRRWLQLTLEGADPTGDLAIPGASDPAWALAEDIYARPRPEQVTWVTTELERIQADPACTP